MSHSTMRLLCLVVGPTLSFLLIADADADAVVVVVATVVTV